MGKQWGSQLLLYNGVGSNMWKRGNIEGVVRLGARPILFREQCDLSLYAPGLLRNAFSRLPCSRVLHINNTSDLCDSAHWRLSITESYLLHAVYVTIDPIHEAAGFLLMLYHTSASAGFRGTFWLIDSAYGVQERSKCVRAVSRKLVVERRYKLLRVLDGNLWLTVASTARTVF